MCSIRDGLGRARLALFLLGIGSIVGGLAESARGVELDFPIENGVLRIETASHVRMAIEDSGRLVLLRDTESDQEVRVDARTRTMQMMNGESRMALPLPQDEPLEIRRDGQLVLSILFRPTEPPRRPAASRAESTEAQSITLYTVSRQGELIRLQVRGNLVETNTLVQLGAPFSTLGVLTEGLASDGDGALYAVANIDIKKGSGYRMQLDQRGESVLYKIDSQSGETRRLGAIGHAQVDGLSFHDGDLYGVTSVLGGGRDAQLLKINRKNGKAETIASELNLPDLDALAIDERGRALIVDGGGVQDAIYEIEFDKSARPKRVSATPPIIPDGRDLEAATFAADGALYAFTSADQHPAGRVYLLRINPRTWKHENLGLLEFGADCLAAKPGEAD